MECIKVILLLGLVLSIDARRLIGGKTSLSGDELVKAEGILIEALNQLASDGPNYKLIKIISAKKQIVAGTKYDYEVELHDGTSPKTCTVKIVSKPWVPASGTDFTLECPDYKTTKTLY